MPVEILVAIIGAIQVVGVATIDDIITYDVQPEPNEGE